MQINDSKEKKNKENGKLNSCKRNVKYRIQFYVLSLLHHFIAYMYGYFMIVNNFNSEVDLVRQLFVFTPAFKTNWNFLFQTTFLSLALIYDILQWLDKLDSRFAQKIRYTRDVLFSGLVVPMSMFISTMFWTVYWIDRELVFPKVYDQVVPWWFNHCVHTNIVVVVLIETLLQARRYPADQKVELFLNGFVGVSYAIVYYSIYYFSNRWLYAVFGIMTWWQVCLYQILIWTSCFVFYFIQFPINRLFHKAEEAENTEVPAQVEEVDEVRNGTVPETEKPTELEKNGNIDFKVPPFSTKSWSLKYRSIRSQFENSRL